MADLYGHVLKTDKSIDFSKQCWEKLRKTHSEPRRPGFIKHFDYLNGKYVYMAIPEFKAKSQKRPELEKQVEKTLKYSATHRRLS